MENAASLQGQAMGKKGIAREHLSVLVGQASRKDEESSYGRIQAQLGMPAMWGSSFLEESMEKPLYSCLPDKAK